MEADPIIIRITAIDEATATISKITNSLNQIQTPSGLTNVIGNVQHKVVNTITSMNKMVDPVKDFQKQLGMMDVTPVERLDQTLKMAGLTESQFTNFLQNNNMELIKGVGVYDQLTGAVISQGQAVKLATIQSRRFKMEWLSIMFAGMALERVFSGIVKAQMSLYGITQLTADMWTVVMAPAMTLVSEGLYDIIDKIMQLPESTQMTIGLTVLGLETLGKVLGGIGQIYLAGMGLKTLFPKIATAIGAAGGGIMGVFKTIGTALAGISTTFLLVAGIVAVVLAGIYLAWKENFMGMKNILTNLWEGVKTIFNGIAKVIGGVLEVIVGLFTGDFEKVKEGLVKTFKGLANILIGIVNTVTNAVWAIVVGVIRIVVGVIQTIANAIIWVGNAMSKLTGSIAQTKSVDWVSQLSNWTTPNTTIPSFKTGGVMPYTGMAYLHEGETIIPKDKSGQNITLNVTNNISVSDKAEMEKLLKNNNIKLVEEVKRQIR